MVPVARFFRVECAVVFRVDTAGHINVSQYSIAKMSVDCLVVDEPVYVCVFGVAGFGVDLNDKLHAGRLSRSSVFFTDRAEGMGKFQEHNTLSGSEVV